MSYRKWMKKWQVVIFWAVAAAFVVGIGWWSAAYYVRAKSARSSATKPDLEYLARYSTAYLVKGATDVEISSKTFLGGLANILVLQDVDYGIGTVEPTRMWVETDDFEKVYQSIKAYYESAFISRTIDPVFEDYLLRAQTVAYMGFTRLVQDYMQIEPIPSSTPSTDEVISYFEENATSLAPLFSEYHIKVVTLDSTELSEFQKYLLTLGFEEAATKVGQEVFDLGSMTGEEALGLGIDEKIVREMYEIGESGVVGPQPYGSGWLFAEVVDSTPVKSASDLTSDEIEKLRNRLVSERMDAYLSRMRDHYEKRGEAIVINDDTLRLWYEYYSLNGVEDAGKLVKLDEKVRKYVLKEDGEVNVESLSVLQSLYVMILETEKAFLNYMKSLLSENSTSTDLQILQEAFGNLDEKKIDERVKEIDDLRKKIVSNLYYEGYKVYGVLRRMVELFKDDKYRLELAEVSTEGKKEVATRLMYMYGVKPHNMLNNFMPEVQTFYGIIHSDAATPLKLKAMEDAYELLKFLGLYEAASSTLNDLKEASPSYKGWNFDEKFKELEKLIEEASKEATSTEASPTSISTPTTEASE